MSRCVDHFILSIQRAANFVVVVITSNDYPAYILAYTYTGVFDFSGPVLTFLRDSGAPLLMSPLLNIRSLPGAL